MNEHTWAVIINYTWHLHLFLIWTFFTYYFTSWNSNSWGFTWVRCFLFSTNANTHNKVKDLRTLHTLMRTSSIRLLSNTLEEWEFGLGKKEGDLWGVHLGLWEEQACAGVERRVPGSGALTLQMGKKVTGTNLPFFQCLLKAGPNRVIGCGNRKLTDDGVQPESIFLDSCTSAPSPIFCCTAQARKHLFPPLDFLLGPRTPVSAQVPLRRSSVGHWSPQGTSPLLTTSCFHRRRNYWS